MSIPIGRSNLFLVDRLTGAAIFTTVANARINDGNSYHVYATDLALADSAYLSIALKSDTYVHIKRIEPFIDADYGYFSIIEGCTVSGGVAGEARNRNRASTRPINAEVYTGVTITGGTEIEAMIASGGGALGGSSPASTRPSDLEMVLAPNVQYAFKFLNSTGGAAKLDLWVGFYEENLE